MKKYLRPLSYLLTALAAAGLTLALTAVLEPETKLEELENLIEERFIGELDPVML